MTDLASLTRDEAAERGRPPRRRAVRRARRPARPVRGRALGGHLDDLVHLPRARRRAPSSTASGDVVVGDPQRRAARPGDRRARSAPAPGPPRRQRAGRQLAPDRHRHRATRSCAPSTPTTSWSTSGPPSSPTWPATPWPASTSPTSRRVHGFVVERPETWTVHQQLRARARSRTLDDGGRRWTFGDTPPLSTYVTVVNAGPFHELRSARGGHDLGLYCRQSLKQFLERDAEELFDLTERGLRLLRRAVRPAVRAGALRPGLRAQHGRRDGELGLRHLDRQRALPQHPDLRPARRPGAEILLHEMAHMWFGDLVTMRWWDDLWLNEAFASWASNWAAVNATEFTDEWATFLAGGKMGGYRAGHVPGHPPDPRRGARRRAGDGQLRRDHLHQGRERPQAAHGLRRRGRLRRGPARLLPRRTRGATPCSTT